mgnify:CR=1 FL=1
MIADEVALKSKDIVKQSREAHKITEIKSIKRQLGKIRRKLNKPMIQEVVHQELLIQQQNVWADFVILAATEDFGTYNLITAGLKDFEELLKARPKKPGKRAERDLEFTLWKTIESRARGKLDPKNNGQEQTNGRGLTSLQNCSKVFDALLGKYLPGHEINNR